jgi:flagellar P-ring protein FlgI
VAAVIVTADLPPYAKSGSRISITISSINDATSLAGGVLVQTPLMAADGNIYAVGQGQIATGLGVGSRAVGSGDLNVVRITNGALVEKEVPSTIVKNENVSIILNNPDFSTADRVIQSINTSFNSQLAKATDAGTIQVGIPVEYKDNIVKLVAQLESLTVNPDTVAKVIINERTGTVVVGRDVRISAVVVSHGNISVSVQNKFETTVSTVQAAAYPPKGELTSDSVTTRVVGNGIVKDGFPRAVLLEEGSSIHDLVNALNALGVGPSDLIAILQAIKEAGALQAEIEVI